MSSNQFIPPHYNQYGTQSSYSYSAPSASYSPPGYSGAPTTLYPPPDGPPHSVDHQPSLAFSSISREYPPPPGPPPIISGGYAPPSSPPPPSGSYAPPGPPPPSGGYVSSPSSSPSLYPPLHGSPSPHPESHVNYNTQLYYPSYLHPPGQSSSFMPTPQHQNLFPPSIYGAPASYYFPHSHAQGTPAGHYYFGVEIAPPPPAQIPSNLITPGFNPQLSARQAHKAMKGFGTDEKELTAAIASLNPIQLEAVKIEFQKTTGKDLIKTVEGETSRYYREALRGKLLGPVGYDCWLIDRACRGAGTHEDILTEVLLDRTNEDMQILKSAYQTLYRKDLTSTVRSELSMKTKAMFTMALAGRRGGLTDGPHVDGFLDQAKVDQDVTTLYKKGAGRIGTDEKAICNIIVNSGQVHLRAVVHMYDQKYGKLCKVIEKEFSGHMRDALIFIVKGYEGDGYGIDRDVEYLEASMKGLGTKDERLIYRVLRGHWNKPRFEQVKATYQRHYGKTLMARVRGETSGDYKDFMVAVLAS